MFLNNIEIRIKKYCFATVVSDLWKNVFREGPASQPQSTLSRGKNLPPLLKNSDPPQLGPTKTVSIIVFRIALTLDVKIVWFCPPRLFFWLQHFDLKLLALALALKKSLELVSSSSSSIKKSQNQKPPAPALLTKIGA